MSLRGHNTLQNGETLAYYLSRTGYSVRLSYNMGSFGFIAVVEDAEGKAVGSSRVDPDGCSAIKCAARDAVFNEEGL